MVDATPQDFVNAIVAQRDRAMNEAAQYASRLDAANRHVLILEARIIDLEGEAIDKKMNDDAELE